MATSQEEIDRQHGEAIGLLSKDPIERVDRGEIPLTQKTIPTCERTHNGHDKSDEESATDNTSTDADADRGCGELVCISSRGQVNVGPLQDLILEGYNEPKEVMTTTTKTKTKTNTKTKKGPAASAATTSTKAPTRFSKTNLWDEANAAKNNVALTRPSHDSWGIKKIVLIFCDDFLRDVYEMPWWHGRSDIRDAIAPILDCLNVPDIRIVRMLLAALPPGVTIPVHHDTGEWVKHTHRVHVPVVVPDQSKVLFRCGPTVNSMHRVDCQPGHVFEMNNQAKHAVSNCHETKHRVHLILDYVDKGGMDLTKRRVQLQPGERLLQTRRSIDRLCDKGSRPTPSYLILGAQKAGTTSLYEYIVQHPLVIRARRRETHCLDWRWNDKLKTTPQHKAYCLNFFFTEELQFHPSCQTGDSTPSYLLDSKRVIPRLRQVFDHPLRFLVMVRDPVQRAHSHYAMATSTDGTPGQLKTRGSEWRQLSFEQVVQKDMEIMDSCGLIPYWDAKEGVVDETIWNDFVGSTREEQAWDEYLTNHIPLNTGSHSLLARGMYELQLRSWLKEFGKESFLILRLEDMKTGGNGCTGGKGCGGGVQSAMAKVWQHLDLPQYEVEDDAPKNTREYDPMMDEMRSYLRRFYKPHNERLGKLLESMNGPHEKDNDSETGQYRDGLWHYE